MPLLPRSRLPAAGISIFTVMSQLAEEHGAINLSQGFPDFDAAPELTALAGEWFSRGRNQYAPMAGVLSLREELAASIERPVRRAVRSRRRDHHHRRRHRGALLDDHGARAPGRRSAARRAVLRLGTCRRCSSPAACRCSRRYVFPDYRLDWDEVRARLSTRTRLVVLNSPHNPTGTVFGEDDIRQLAAMLDGTSVMVLSDEVYEHLTFDGRRHVSIASVPELAGVRRSSAPSARASTQPDGRWAGSRRRPPSPPRSAACTSS